MIFIRNPDDITQFISSCELNDIELFTGIVKAHEIGIYNTFNYNFLRNEKGEVMIKGITTFHYTITICKELVDYLYYSYNIMQGNT